MRVRALLRLPRSASNCGFGDDLLAHVKTAAVQKLSSKCTSVRTGIRATKRSAGCCTPCSAVVWNGTPVKDINQLESYFHTEVDKPVQAEIHLRPDRRVKYDAVAKVLAAAQRNRMKKIGFVNTSEFKD